MSDILTSGLYKLVSLAEGNHDVGIQDRARPDPKSVRVDGRIQEVRTVDWFYYDTRLILSNSGPQERY